MEVEINKTIKEIFSGDNLDKIVDSMMIATLELYLNLEHQGYAYE